MKIGYLRVSGRSQCPDLQHDALKAAGCDRIFADVASGTRTDRPQLAEALRFARSGDSVAVWRLDRLARSVPHLIEIVGDLNKRQIGFISLTENLDTTTPGGLLLFHVMGAIGQFERSLISERTTAGLAAARQRGRVGGRPRAMTEQDIVAAKAMLRSNELTAAEVANQIGVSVSTLYRWIPAARAAT
jgi:DNA invertase Pin-like site-specific DNA recombinase